MRKLFVLTSGAFLFIACDKTSSPNQQQTLSDSSGWVASFTANQPQLNHIFSETLSYDDLGNLTGLTYRSETDQPQPFVDSGSFLFTYDTVTRLIIAYSDKYRKTGYTADNTEDHLLIYDNQNQILADSTTKINGLLLSPSIVTHFSYSNQLAVSKTSNEIDSLTIISGNVTQEAFYSNSGSIIQPDYTDYFSPNSNFTNPFYNQKIPVTVRTFLTLLWFNDWVSKDLPDWQSEKVTWAKDSKGRVASGTGDAGSKITYTYH
jgi:hypothetical protein